MRKMLITRNRRLRLRLVAKDGTLPREALRNVVMIAARRARECQD